MKAQGPVGGLVPSWLTSLCVNFLAPSPPPPLSFFGLFHFNRQRPGMQLSCQVQPVTPLIDKDRAGPWVWVEFKFVPPPVFVTLFFGGSCFGFPPRPECCLHHLFLWSRSSGFLPGQPNKPGCDIFPDVVFLFIPLPVLTFVVPFSRFGVKRIHGAVPGLGSVFLSVCPPVLKLHSRSLSRF